MSFLLSLIWFVCVQRVWTSFKVAGIVGAAGGVFLAPVEFLTFFAVWVFFSRVKVLA